MQVDSKCPLKLLSLMLHQSTDKWNDFSGFRTFSFIILLTHCYFLVRCTRINSVQRWYLTLWKLLFTLFLPSPINIFRWLAFFQEFFQGGTNSIVMLIFLLFSDQILGGKSPRGRTASDPLWKKARVGEDKGCYPTRMKSFVVNLCYW